MAAEKDSEIKDILPGNGKRHSIVDIPVADPVLVPTVVLYAARTVGKTSVLNALETVDGNYYAVQSWAPGREQRSGESLEQEQSACDITLEDLVTSPVPFVLGYHEDNQMYAYPANGFDASRIPVVRVIGKGALQMLEEWGTLPHKLKIHLTLDPENDDDITTRAISRLIRKEKLPKGFKLTPKSSSEESDLITTRREYVRERVRYFKEQADVSYDATFDNSIMHPSDPRQFLYEQKPEAIVLTDIALRINELYHRWREQCNLSLKEGREPMTSRDLHHSYVTDVCVHLFGKGTQSTWSKQKLKTKTSVAEYASTREIDEKILRERILKTRGVACVRDTERGRFSVYLEPTDGPIHIDDITSHSSLDFEVLGYLGQCVAIGAGNVVTSLSYGPRPKFEVSSDGIVRGVIWSLTDVRPVEEDKDKGKIRYHELFVGYKH